MLAEQEYVQHVTFSQKFYVSIILEFKTLFRGRKWISYVIIGLLPIFFSLISGDKLFGNPNPRAAFIDSFMGTLFLLLFTFGCLILALPLSSDEMSDHILDLYITRPFSREAIWFSRWVVANIGVIIVNVVIACCYYFYFQLVAPKSFFSSTLTSNKDVLSKITTLVLNIPSIVSDMSSNSDLLWKMTLFLIACTLTYTGIFLLIGFLGKNALAIGVFVAIFEVFLSALLFIKDQFYLPRTDLQVIATNIFGADYQYTFAVPPLTVTLFGVYFSALTVSMLYIFTIAFVFLAAGAYFVKIREVA